MVSAGGALVALRIVSVGDRPLARWAEGQRVLMPSTVLDRTGWRAAVRADGDFVIPPSGDEQITDDHVASLRERCAFTDRAPLSARLPVSYQRVPGWLRAAIASVIGRRKRRRADEWGAFPQWPLDLSTDVLSDLKPGRPPRVSGGPAPVVLTHDIDSAEGLASLVANFLPIEEAFGARSTNYVVPCAWEVDRALAADLVARGHQIGVHGYDHANRTPFAGAGERARRLDAAAAFAREHGASGYRAPSLLRTRALLRDVGTRFGYDSSIPTSGGLFPVPNNGCATARPFRIENVAELPVTMPRDGSLRFLGFAPDDILHLWIDCAETIARARGVVVLLTHCEHRFSGNRAMLGVYRRFLDYLAGHADRFAFTLPERALARAA